jgi:hypothetical protein
MLAVMVVCVVTMRVLIRVKEVLPHNPCSIAGTATLLAGSEMASRRVIPEGSEWQDYGEVKKAGVMDGWLFALGWWDEAESGKRFGVDVQGEKG